MKANRGALQSVGQLTFHPGVNVIRGPNGIGKTTILEWISLLGHISLLSQDTSPSGLPELEMTLEFTKHDKAFVDWLRKLPAGNEIRSFFEEILSKNCITNAIFDSEIVLPRFININFYLNNIDEKMLKTILVDEQNMHKSVEFSISEFISDNEENNQSKLTKDPEKIEKIGDIIRALNMWSRPKQVLDEKSNSKRYKITPHTLARSRQNITNYEPSFAPVFFYLNTDMYEFGIGLDIRESPKDIRSNINQLLMDRLQLVDPVDVRSDQKYFSDSVSHSDVLVLKDFLEVQAAWDDVFNLHPLTGATVKKTGQGNLEIGKLEDDFDWTISIANREDAAAFISSGENQALFVLSMIFSLAQPGSCMLLDEPELHLSFWSGSRLLEKIRQRCIDIDAQCIIVTHLPHLYREMINSLENDLLWKNRSENSRISTPGRNNIRMIYISIIDNKLVARYDREATILAARESFDDVKEVVDGLRLPAKIPIFPRFWHRDA